MSAKDNDGQEHFTPVFLNRVYMPQAGLNVIFGLRKGAYKYLQVLTNNYKIWLKNLEKLEVI